MSVQTTIDDGIGTLVLDHPPLNILTRSVLADLRERLAELARASSDGTRDGAHGEVRALLVTATADRADLVVDLTPDAASG